MRRLARFVLTALVIALAFFPGTAKAQQTAPVYVVQEGDTLSVLARAFGTTVDALATANAISDPSLLYPGVELIIPSYEGLQGRLRIEQVAFGESLRSLSSRFDLTVDLLQRLNRVVQPERIYAGQPWIVLESAESSATHGGHRIVLPRKGESSLISAVREQVNPWWIAAGRFDSLRKWRLPDAPLLLPGDQPLAHALPEPIQSVSVEPQPAVQGKTTVFRLRTSEELDVHGSLGDDELHFFRTNGGDLIALQGIHAMAEPGLYEVEIELGGPESMVESYIFRQPLSVVPGDYGFENINGVPEETIDPEVTEPEEALVAELLAPATPDRAWSDPFLFPSTYYTESFPSVFGTRRSYNWGAFNYYHTGLDFYANTGMPLQATAPGRVVFAGPLKVRGNVTYIDHGWGVYSGYFHQSAIFVQEGDVVDKGEVIGEVGGTGRSTGPHMHWEIWVGGVPVDPLDWVERSFP